jgi:catechol 2,3-dioxygenase-like lactoylglutathione lyase family enzyme
VCVFGFPGDVRDREDVTHQPITAVHAPRVGAAVGGAHADVVDGVEVGGTVPANDRLHGPDSRRANVNWTLEVVVVPVTDIDRAKAFYADQLGFHLDHDTVINEQVRVVQLTPPGSGCSIVIGKGAVPDMAPGSLKGLQLVVPDIHKARAELVERGVRVSEVQKMGENPREVPDPLDNVGFVFFDDPDGNSWAVQQLLRG